MQHHIFLCITYSCNKMNSELNDSESLRSPTEKRSVVVGVRREQVLGNDPLVDPLSSPTPASQNNFGIEDAVPAVPSNSNSEASKLNNLSKYSPLMDYPVPPSAPAGVNTMYDSLRQPPMDKIDQMAEAFIRSCRYH